jgi:hypothetical protein
MAGPQLPFTETLQNPLSFLGVETKPDQPTNRLEKEAADLGAREEQFLKSNIDLTRQLGDMMIKDAEGKNLLKIKEKELEAEHSRERKRIRDRLGEEYYNSPDMQEFKKFADESADKMMFVPSQTTAPLLGVVFSTIGATGLLLGGLSKGNAKAALSAMNGMAEGFTKGKEDLYKQERQTFDTNVKAMTQRMAILKSKLDVARDKMKYDAESADIEANAAFAEAGADFLKTNKDKFGLQDSITKLETQIKQNDTWARLMETKKSAAIKELETQRFKAHESELNRNQQFTIQQILETGREERAEADRALRTVIAQGQLASQQANRELNLEIANLKAQGSSKSTQQFLIAQRAITALRGAASTMETVMKLPQDARVGFLPFLSTKEGMYNFVKNAGGRSMSSAEEKAVETLYAGMARYLATIEASGTATGLAGLSEQLKAVYPKSGDSVYDVALKIADTRRIATEAVSAMVESGLLPGQQAKAAQEQIERFERIIPFTTNDVVEAEFAGKKTLGGATAIFSKPIFGKPTPSQSGPKEGDRATSKSGKAMVFKNGAWEYGQ